jgi:hypothetical protein
MNPGARADDLREVEIWFGEKNEWEPNSKLIFLVEASDLERFVDLLRSEWGEHPLVMAIMCKPVKSMKYFSVNPQGTWKEIAWGSVGDEYIVWENPLWEHRCIREDAEENFSEELALAIEGKPK